MHITKWTKYCELDSGVNNSFSNIGSRSGSQEIMHAFAEPHSLHLRALINKDIVDIIIGYMMFHPEDMFGITRARLLASFVPNLDYSEDAADTGNVSRYDIIIGNTKQFQWSHNIWLMDCRSIRCHR